MLPNARIAQRLCHGLRKPSKRTGERVVVDAAIRPGV